MANNDKVTSFSDLLKLVNEDVEKNARDLGMTVEEFRATPGGYQPPLALAAFFERVKEDEEQDAKDLGMTVEGFRATPGAYQAPFSGLQRSSLGLSSTKTKADVAGEVPASLKPSDWVTARPVSMPTSAPSPAAKATPRPSVSQVPTTSTVREYSRDPAVYAEANMLPPLSKEQQARPLSDEELAAETERARRLMAKDAASVSTPIPVNLASPRSDTAPVKSEAIAPSGPTTPAPPADTGGKPSLPAPTAGAGGDAMNRLGLGEAFVRALEGSGSIIAGRDLRSGAAETLAERMKQIEALRAKREEQGLEQQRERATWGASNRATLASFMAQYKDRPEVVEALRAQEPGADTTKPSDFLKNIVGSLTTPPKVAGIEATTKKTEAGAGRTLEQTATDVATRPGKVAKLEADTELSRARKAKVYKDMEIAGAKLALDERKTLEQAQQAKDPFKKLESLNTIADKKEFGGFTTLAGDLADLERVAPGFVTRGEVPEWLTREQQLLGQNWPSSTDPRVVDFLSKYGKVANEERHRQYGSAQTDGELRSFMQQLNSSPLSAGPQVLARQVKSFADAAGRVAKGRLTRYNNVFGAENVDTVFAPEWKPLFDKGGVFAAQGSPFMAPRPSATAGGAPEASTVIIRRKADGKTKTVPAADRAKWLANPEFEEVK